MTSKERMMLAVNREKPDRLPVTIHQWQPYHLQKYMGGISDIEAFRLTGMDAAITWYRVTETTSPNWRVLQESSQQYPDYLVRHYRVETPEGELSYALGENPMTTWVIEHLVKEIEDIELIHTYQPVPLFDRKGFLKKQKTLGDDGIMRTFIWGYQGGCWQDACELMGVTELILAAYDKPDWVHRFLSILCEKKIAYIERNLQGLPVDLVETGGGASSNTVISPAMHKEFCLPYDRRIHEALSSLGHKSVYHTCGGMMHILGSILDNGADVSETLSPHMVGGDIAAEDLPLVKEMLGEKMGLIGGIDQINILPSSTEVIGVDVREKFNTLGKNGGYIMSACDHFFELPVENLKVYARAAAECRY